MTKNKIMSIKTTKGEGRRNVVVERLTLLLRIRQVPGSNLGPKNGYIYGISRGFPQPLQANYVILPLARSQPLTSTSFTVYHSPVLLSFDAI
jgi:hypothetical protein